MQKFLNVATTTFLMISIFGTLSIIIMTLENKNIIIFFVPFKEKQETINFHHSKKKLKLDVSASTLTMKNQVPMIP